MVITVLGRRWKFEWFKRYTIKGDIVIVGDCSSPNEKNKRLRLAKGLKGSALAEELLHEMLHAAGWHVTEEYIKEFSSDYRKAAEKFDLFQE